MPPDVGDRAPEFEALLCDGETFASTHLSAAAGDRGTVLTFFGFAFSAIATNWWTRYRDYGFDDRRGVCVLGVGRDGPYAQNKLLREVGRPGRIFADVNATAIDRYDLLVDREDMANVSTARRAVFVLDDDLAVRFRWVADSWIDPQPVGDIFDALDELES